MTISKTEGMPTAWTLALLQMRVLGGERERNVEHAVDLIRRAKTQGADIALLPECMDLGWTDPSAKQEATAIPDGYVFQQLSEAAKRHHITLCAGLTEKNQGKVYNTAVLIDAKGKLLSRHRKIHELEIAHDLYDLGGTLQVVPTEFGQIGVMICADATAKDQVLTRSLGYMGADVILSPCAWAVPPSHDNENEPYGSTWLDAYGPVAKDFHLHIAGVSNVGRLTGGPWSGWPCIGCSLVVGPDGQPLFTGNYGKMAEEVSLVRITPSSRPAQGTAWKRYWET